MSSSFISLTDKVLREISVVEIVGCTLNMCFLGYYTITVCISYKKYVPCKTHRYFEAISENNVYNSYKFSNTGIFTFQEWESKETTSYITYIVLLISLTFNIFIFCYIGELVAEKVNFSQNSKSKGRTVYICDKFNSKLYVKDLHGIL